MTEHQPPSDESVALPAQDVVGALVSHHRDFLAFLERRVGSRALAEDLLQESFARALDKLDSLHKDESAVAWFYRILRNGIIDQQRRGAAGSRSLEAFARELDTHQAPEEDVKNVLCRCIGVLADTLKPEYAEALKRIELDGVAVKDYAEEAGISASNAAVRVFRARDALRKQVARSCGTCAEHGCLDCTCGAGTKGCGT